MVSPDPIGLYVHFPWCLEKCPYCDFLSIAVPRDSREKPASPAAARRWIPHRAYADAVLRELRMRLRTLPAVPPLRSIFFGGGTPSLWEPEEIGRIVAKARAAFAQSDHVEVTVECNPTSVDARHFERLLNAGVNRVSIGVQAIDDQRLAFLGRLHDERGGLAALHAAQQAGVPRISADLIFGVHRQAPAAAVRDAERVADTGVEHVSAYALTIEPGTRFGALHRTGRLPLLEDDLVAQSFEAVSDALTKAGLRHYEVSNFARPGAESRHNVGYWSGRDYLGLGTGAYGTVGLKDGSRVRYKNLLSPERYMEAFGTDGAEDGLPEDLAFDPYSDRLSDREVIDAATSVSEAIMLGLRMAEGIEPAGIEQRFQVPFWTPERRRASEPLLRSGRLQQEEERLRIPPEHWLFADGIVRELM